MRKTYRVLGALSASVALTGSALLSGALAKAPGPAGQFARDLARRYTFNGSVQINDVLRVQKNNSVYGVLYAHRGEQVWKGLLVRDGLKVDTINDTGPLQAQSATIANALQAGAITGTSINSTGNANVAGTLTAQGKLTANGVDGGPGGLTTSAAVSAASLNTTGNAAIGGDFAATGPATFTGGMTVGGPVSLTNASITGTVNFTNATVTGLNVGNLNFNGATVTSFNVGNTSGTAAPLNVSANGRTATVGVNASGQLAVDGLATANNADIGGTLNVAGQAGISTPSVQGPAGSNGTVGQLQLQGSGILLNGPVTLANQSDLNLTYGTSNAASHILANRDGDVAGRVTVTASGDVPTGGFSTTVTYAKPYGDEPAVSLTPASDPAQGGAASRYWVTPVTNSNGQYVGFTVHYSTPASVSTTFNMTFYYTVIGIGR